MSGPPLVIAHRGASGYLPEHTREAKALAYGQGADYLEQDVVASRDGRLVVLHDLWLDEVTDVAVRFPDRRRDDGRHYVIDLDLEELLTLRVVERRRPGSDALAFPGRFADSSLDFRIVTLDEEIRLVTELNRATGRRVGLYPEIKAPAFHRRHGIDLAARLLETLDRHGYTGPGDAAIVQCFDGSELKRCRRELGTRLKLAQPIERGATASLEADALAGIAEHADAIAPHHGDLFVQDPRTGRPKPSGWVRQAAKLGLELHPFTFRREETPACFESFEAFIELALERAGAAALFCDQPDAAVRARDRVLARRRSGGAGTA